MTELSTTGELSTHDRIALLSGRNFWQTRDLPTHDVAAVRLADGPHGLRVQGAANDHLGLAPSIPATCFPPAATLAASWDEALVREVGAAVGREARALGVGVVLGPGLNIKRHPRCGRNFEYYSEDPLLSGLLAAAAVDGIQSAGVAACVKHFAVNNQEHRRFVLDVVVDERTLHETYLRGFEIAVRTARPRLVMAAYNAINGIPCAENHELLTGVLRTQWGFDGAVVSDWGGVADAPAATRAGLDLEMPRLVPREKDFDAALREGRVTLDDVETASRRVLALQDLAFPPGAERLPAEIVAEHDSLARRAAARSAVVLRNDGVLPLRGTPRVAVIGAFAERPRYQGAGSSLVVPTRVTTALDAFAAAGIEVTYAPGYDPRSSPADDGLVREAVRVAADADVVVVLAGLPAAYETEGIDRDDLALPAQHDALISAVAAVNARTIVALSNGSPVVMPWRDDVAAILECYLGGQASGGALVDALLGVVEPAGRLAESFPVAMADNAASPYFPGGLHQVQYREGVFVGYRHHVTSGPAPAFPFGHGLGYGRTTWSTLRLSTEQAALGATVTVTVDVTNEGERPTTDLVQVYATDRTGVVLRPARELVGFARVELAPGQTRRAEIDVPVERLAFWDVLTHAWRIPTGRYTLHAARSSENVESSLDLIVAGDTARSAETPDVPAISVTDRDFAIRLGHGIPAETPMRPFTRESTMADLQTTRPGRLFRKVIDGAGGVDEQTRNDPVAMRLVRRSTDELPLRALVQFSGGKLPWPLVDAVVALANGSLVGLARAVAGRPPAAAPRSRTTR